MRLRVAITLVAAIIGLAWASGLQAETMKKCRVFALEHGGEPG